ncbi:ATP-binding protein [Hahella sp. SMD15-11]|uniref:histidine kinase n=1 Tax=Thermohahella caldifontis TaxID=3142973 RepID=A0AB39UUY7_9GAMM
MNFNVWVLLALGLGYLGALYLIAQLADNGRIPERWVRSPLTYILSLGVYASSWALFGTVGMAYEYGYGFLAFYLGVCGAWLLSPVLLVPVLKITRTYQLSSLADLFTFRYRSQLAGTITTLLMLIAALPLMALQIQAVTSIVQTLAPGQQDEWVSLIFVVAIALFTVIFGARGQYRSDRHPGLVTAIAFESLFKLAVYLGAGIWLVWEFFGGPLAMDQWIQENATRISAMDRHLSDGPWRAMLLLFFSSALVMPHMFQMTFTENLNSKALYRASWGFPLYLLLIALPVPVYLWGGIHLSIPTSPEYFPLGLGAMTGSPFVSLLMFLAGLAAASGLLIVTTLALAAMALNHLVLPVYQPLSRDNIYTWLNWTRRILILAIFAGAYLYAAQLSPYFELSELGIISFSAALQFLPGVLAVIYWPQGNRKGLLAGILGGFVIWLVTLPLPQLLNVDVLALISGPDGYVTRVDDWHIYVMTALTVNVVMFVVVTLFTETSRAEQSAAQACSVDTLMRPSRRELIATSSEEFKDFLAEPLGRQTAEREVNRALMQLGLNEVEYRPYALRRLRDQIEANLSGLLGPAIAQDIVRRSLGFKSAGSVSPAQDIHYVETRLETYQDQLTGLAAELDTLRRHHRQTLQHLPMAACSLGEDFEILMWNQAMESLTGIPASEVIGSHVSSIPAPWATLLYSFAKLPQKRIPKKRIDVQGRPRWFNLHKSTINDNTNDPMPGQVILVEDYTETQLLEEELVHSSRLASIGRLAAGVAHEVGNPVTGIACLAQNLKLMTREPEVLETAEQILEQTQRISRILQTLMNFARSGNHVQASFHEPTHLRKCVDDAIHLLSLSDKGPRVVFENLVPDDLIVLGDDQRLVQVFINLLSNARDASEEGGYIRVTAERRGYITHIEVEDEGCGIPQDQLDHIFEPFFTTKGPDQGTGLGLSLVYSIVEEHYGNIRYESPANPVTGKGTRVVIELPAAEVPTPQHEAVDKTP